MAYRYAGLALNITPNVSSYQNKLFLTYAVPSEYGRLHAEMGARAEFLRKNNTTTQFAVRSATANEKNRRVALSGTLYTWTSDKKAGERNAVFMVGFRLMNGNSMFQTSRKLPIGIFLATLLLMNSEASATQILRGKADDTLAASLSRVEPTLIRVDGHRIRHVFDAEGDFTVMPDKEAGTAYLKLMTDKPVFSAFVSDETGRTWKPRLSVIEGPLKGEKYRITNTSDKPMVVD